MSIWHQMFLQDSNSSIMENMMFFHDHAMLIIMVIIMMIMYMFMFMLMNKLSNRYMFEGQMIEMIWTILPMFFLMFIAFPSLKILYLTDEINNPEISIKSIGHQWYWSYEYNDFFDINFDSFMINNNENNDDKMNLFRLLDVDNRMVIPKNCQIRLLISSSDVIHSFSMPSAGIKVDAVPGRINQISMNFIRPGTYFGQCSEICGVNHSFMPIVIESVPIKIFMNWLINM